MGPDWTPMRIPGILILKTQKIFFSDIVQLSYSVCVHLYACIFSVCLPCAGHSSLTLSLFQILCDFSTNVMPKVIDSTNCSLVFEDAARLGTNGNVNYAGIDKFRNVKTISEINHHDESESSQQDYIVL